MLRSDDQKYKQLKNMTISFFNHLLRYREKNRLISMDNQERFSLLEELLQQSPGQSVWDAICELFITWSEENKKEEALDYADKHLSHWDSKLRHVTSAWSPLYSDGKVSSIGKLIRSIQIYRRSDEGTKELIRIANSPYLQNLKYLSIIRCEIYNEGFTALASSPYIKKLTHLEIHNTVLQDEEFETLLNSPNLACLRFLKLIRTDLSDKDIIVITQSSFSKSLTHLDLSQNWITPEGAKIIAQAKNFQNLKYLNLKSNSIGDTGGYELAQSLYLQNLEYLNIYQNKLSQEGINALKKASYFQQTNIVFSE